MTRNTVDALAHASIVVVERAGYLLAFAPFFIDRLRTGLWPTSVFSLALDSALGAVIFLVAALMGYARRQAIRVNSLRTTLNEAIIHDLKNPMTAIMGCLSVVLEDGDVPHELRVAPDLGEDPHWVCEEDGTVVASVGHLSASR